jgi:hypothetical protein
MNAGTEDQATARQTREQLTPNIPSLVPTNSAAHSLICAIGNALWDSINI